jgi:mitochondrial fission protein ELM1
MVKDMQNLTCWVVSEGIAGTQNQCLGVCEALGIEPEIKRINLTAPWNFIPPSLKLETAASFTPKLTPPWPDLVIASGRKAIPAARYIRKASKGKSFSVYLQDPRVNPNQFDLVAVPFHDQTRGANVIVTNGAPNRVSDVKLGLAKAQFAPLFEHLKKPRVAVLIGGNSKAYKMTGALTKKLCEQLNALDASLMITASRRTGEENLNIIEKQCANNDNFIWNGSGENPYLGMLAWADIILVTADSTSMISDAGTTGKPSYIIPLDGGSKKFDILHNHLCNLGVTRFFDGTLDHWEYASLRDAQMIADEIKMHFDKK